VEISVTEARVIGTKRMRRGYSRTTMTNPID
jgi:hypothetical protein